MHKNKVAKAQTFLDAQGQYAAKVAQKMSCQHSKAYNLCKFILIALI
jgi:hypothetical protein